MIKIKVNKDKVFDYSENNNNSFLNGELLESDLVQVAENRYHIIKENKSFNIEVYKKISGKVYLIKINNKIAEIEIQDEKDILLEKLGVNKEKSSLTQDVKAPMPGLILDILVKEGDEVTEGTPLIILEAMKMENIIKAKGNGIVKRIAVSQKVAVEKNQVLIEF